MDVVIKASLHLIVIKTNNSCEFLIFKFLSACKNYNDKHYVNIVITMKETFQI